MGDVIRDANLHKIYDPTSIHQLQFRFLRQYHPGWFVIDNGTGVIRSGARIDREAICPGAETCDLRIDVAIQPLQRFRIIRVTVTIDDINDNQPEFSGGERIVEVLESASPGTVLLIPSALDLDGPAFTVQSYKIMSDDGSDRFELVGSGSDEVKLVLAGKLDRETVDMHRVRIVAIDGGYPPKSGHVDLTIIVLDVNDNQTGVRQVQLHGYRARERPFRYVDPAGSRHRLRRRSQRSSHLLLLAGDVFLARPSHRDRREDGRHLCTRRDRSRGHGCLPSGRRGT